jgi:hypothetical protein
MFLITEIAPTVIFMINTRQRPNQDQMNIYDYTNPSSRKSFELNDLNSNVGRNYLDHNYNKK